MWIDTHCHLDAAEFDADRDAVAHAARAAGVSRIVIPSVGRDNFTTVRELAQRTPGAVYALGIHPMFTPRARDGISTGCAWRSRRASTIRASSRSARSVSTISCRPTKTGSSSSTRGN